MIMQTGRVERAAEAEAEAAGEIVAAEAVETGRWTQLQLLTRSPRPSKVHVHGREGEEKRVAALSEEGPRGSELTATMATTMTTNMGWMVGRRSHPTLLHRVTGGCWTETMVSIVVMLDETS